MAKAKNEWGSRLGVIMAVAGSAVGLGNFLRFPGLAAEYGGGAFMIAYAISFLIIGLPIGWAEWAMGRYAGQAGYNSAPGAFAYIVRHPAAKYLGIIGVIVPVVIYMYYVVIEAWCIGYAFKFWTGDVDLQTTAETKGLFASFTGAAADASALRFSWDVALPWLMAVFVFNFWLIYRGISKGIEMLCNVAMPVLMVLAVVVLIRVLTLGAPDPAKPHDSVINGLGYLWNPTKTLVVKVDAAAGEKPREVIGAAAIAEAEQEVAASGGALKIVKRGVGEQLANPDLWLAAASQIFFSLSVGFGVIIVYASYMKRRDDVVLSGLTASSANEFCEVALGGLITVPAGVAFLGTTAIAGVAGSSVGLGFNVLPLVFAKMPLGMFFGGAFFFMLFLAAVTSSISMLQPGIAFLEEALGVGRKVSVTILGMMTLFGCGFVMYFSGDLKALDTLDFWVGTMLIFILATIQILIFGWVWGVDKGLKEAHQGAAVRIPGFFRPVLKWVCPGFLLTVFGYWLMKNLFSAGGEPSSYITDLVGEKQSLPAQLSVALLVAVAVFFVLLTARSKAYAAAEKGHSQNVTPKD
jgi:neurotransmitter:Na+ symporter, NSS family